MSSLRHILSRLCGLAAGGRSKHEIEIELRFHLEMRAQENIDGGMTPEAASEDAMRRFGDFERVKESCYALNAAQGRNRWRACLWLVAGCWLAFWAISPANFGLRGMLHELIAVVILFCVFANARARQKALTHTSVADEAATRLSLHTEAPQQMYDKDGRTPLERLMRDE